jgi:hypothetical protein
VVAVPVGDDDVGYMGFILVRELAGVAEGRLEDGDVFVFAFAGVDEGVRVALADEVGVCPCGGRWTRTGLAREMCDYLEA